MTRLEGNAASLKPWLTLDIPLQVNRTRCTNILYGSFPVGIVQREVGKRLYEANAVIEKVSEDTSGVYVAILCCKEDTPEVLRLLTSYGFLRVNFKEDKENRGTAAAQYKRIQKQMEDLRAESAALTDKLRSLSDNLTSVEILYDITETSLIAAKNRQKMACTESVSILTGWIPAPAEKKVIEVLEKLDSAYELAEPTEEDDPPILLQNNGFAKNFEWVLGMYS
jgi:V/A-type H+-transporting ATPase subunit I